MQLKYIKPLFPFLFVVFSVANTFAQGYGDFNWYFGADNSGIRFTKSDTIPNVINGLPQLGIGASAVATDPFTGNILFYTDGVNVYNAEDNSMLGGTLVANATDVNTALNQIVAICVNPANNDEYYVFTRKNDGTIVYGIIDITGDVPVFLGSGLGEVIQAENALANFTNISPAILIISNAAQDGFQLIAHQTTTGDFLVQDITNTGLTTFSNINVGSSITEVQSISYDPTSDSLAITSTQPNQPVEIVHLATATVTAIPATTGGNSINYSTEWSANGDYIYIAQNDTGAGTGNILQYDITNSLVSLVLNPPVQSVFDLQQAPDGAIYSIYNDGGQNIIGRITNPNIDIAQLIYESDPLNGQSFNATQFPAFLPDYRYDISFNVTPSNVCQNVSTLFNVTLTNNTTGELLTIDEAFWNFGDATTPDFRSGIAPIYTFADATNPTPTISVTVRAGGQIYQQDIPLNITAFEVQISGDQHLRDSVACALPYDITAESSGGNPVFQWSNQETAGATTTIDSVGTYYVVATEGNCATHQTISIELWGEDPETIPEYWYFGDHAAIEFLGGTPTGMVIAENNIDTEEGCGIVTDANGDVVFYTDGVTVWNGDGDEISTGIGGEQSATQAALILEMPGDVSQFYIFTTQQIFDDAGISQYECRYSIYDIKANNGQGGMALTNQFLFEASTERIASNGNWLITHEYGNNTFRAYQISSNGISNPVISDLSTVHNRNVAEAGRGQMKIGANAYNSYVALALSLSSSENYVELFDFDTFTGRVSNPQVLDFPGRTGQVYGVEFSPNGRNLFATLMNGTNSSIFRWEIDTVTVLGNVTDPSHIVSSFNEVVPATGEEFGQLQLGPYNSSIYIASNNATNIPFFSTPNEAFTQGTWPNFTYQWLGTAGFSSGGNAVDLAGQQSKFGLPSSVGSSGGTGNGPGVTLESGCVGTTLSFFAQGERGDDILLWEIYPPGATTFETPQLSGQNVSYTPQIAGTYTVRVSMTHVCDGLTEYIDEEYFVPTAFQAYELPPAQEGIVTDATTCDGNDGAFEVIINTSSSAPTATYTITVDGAIFQQNVSAGTYTFTNASAGTYSVLVTNDDPNACDIRYVTTVGSPNTEFSVNNVTSLADCDGENGELVLTINATNFDPDYNFIVTNETTLAGFSDTQSNEATFNLSAGTYSIEVTDASGCVFTDNGIEIATPEPWSLTTPGTVLSCDEQVEVVITTDASGIQVTGPAGANIVGTDNGFTTDTDGTYTILADDPGNTNRCPTEEQVSVFFSNYTESPLLGQYTMCPEDPIIPTAKLYPGIGWSSVNWFDEQGNSLNHLVDSDTLIVDFEGTIVAEMTNIFSCITYDTVLVVEDCQPRIVAPNAFRPSSNESKNTAFSIYHLLVADENFSVFIYNRWGELIYHSTDVDFEWNGCYDNDISRPAPAGTYAYVMRYMSSVPEDDAERQTRGGVLLIR